MAGVANCAKIALARFSIMSTLFSYLAEATPKKATYTPNNHMKMVRGGLRLVSGFKGGLIFVQIKRSPEKSHRNLIIFLPLYQPLKYDEELISRMGVT